MIYKIFLINIIIYFLNFSCVPNGRAPTNPVETSPHPAIDLGIQNIQQETNSWCWAAVAQQIILWLKGSAPPQCHLVAVAYYTNPQYCCNYPHLCNTPGYMQQIQGLILTYGGRYSEILPPANEMAVYRTLQQGKAIILFLQTTPFIGHFVVLRGMAWVSTLFGYQPIFYINDPRSYFTQAIPFSQLLIIWKSAIVVT